MEELTDPEDCHATKARKNRVSRNNIYNALELCCLMTIVTSHACDYLDLIEIT